MTPWCCLDLCHSSDWFLKVWALPWTSRKTCARVACLELGFPYSFSEDRQETHQQKTHQVTPLVGVITPVTCLWGHLPGWDRLITPFTTSGDPPCNVWHPWAIIQLNSCRPRRNVLEFWEWCLGGKVMGPQTVVSGFIQSYTHLQLGLSRVYWDYISVRTRRTIICFGGLLGKETRLVFVFGKRFCWWFLFKSCFTDITGNCHVTRQWNVERLEIMSFNGNLHPPSLTWHLKMVVSKKGIFYSFWCHFQVNHVQLWEM